MSNGLLDERSEVLPGEPASVGRARRMVSGTLESWGLDALVDDASLLVSEVVTNAVLHAGTEVVVSIRRHGSGVRIEVADGSPVVPTRRRYHGDAVTGRGLQILESTASNWGTTTSSGGGGGGGGGGGDGGGGGGGGKVVWFDLGEPVTGASDGEGPHPAPAGKWTTVCWEGLPSRLVKTTLEHGDAMVRELALLSFDLESGSLPMAPIVTPALELGDLLVAIDLAGDAGTSVIDHTLRLPADAPEAALERLALVDEADRMAADGELLVPAALPEIIACRHWLLGEIVAQAAGGAPTRWTLPAAPAPPRDLQPLTDEEVVLLGEGLSQSVVADQENRIVFAGEEAAHLLGWAPADLVGRRLTDIVPPDLREAHLVGFTRCQLTGQAGLSDTPLALRARRADGTEIDVTVTLGALPRRGGRFRHVGRISPR